MSSEHLFSADNSFCITCRKSISAAVYNVLGAKEFNLYYAQL